MGITLSDIERLEALGVLSGANAGPATRRILDIGSSNLYQASTDGIADFLRRHLSANDARLEPANLDAFASRLSRGSAYGDSSTLNESFVGELLEHAGFGYLAFDIAKGYGTEIFDLNRRVLDFVGSVDTSTSVGEVILDDEWPQAGTTDRATATGDSVPDSVGHLRVPAFGHWTKRLVQRQNQTMHGL